MIKRAVLISISILLLAGCASSTGRLGTWEGPGTSAPVSTNAWAARPGGQQLNTEHYRIYTTLTDEQILKTLPQVMEGALQEYREVLPNIPLTGRPMDCYVFNTRNEWVDFTARYTGPEAKIYLQINRGGYCLRDWYVAYYLGDASTYAVASHEGWHQFVNRHFKGRIPPFLEEGLACTFESVKYGGDLPRWNRSINPNRIMGLRHAIDSHSLYPLEKVIMMHAGQVVDQSGYRVEAFYAQAWAFARFLIDGEGGRYRPGLQKLLADIAAGTVPDPTGAMRNNRLNWNPGGVKPVFEQYLGVPFAEIDREYQAYIHKIVDTELAAHFASN